MKLLTIFFIFIAQTRGSWIGDFENTMSSLENGFEKLVTDVVTDVKDTIDCTIVAVESALSFDVNDSLYRKCNGLAYPKPSEYKKVESKQSPSFLGNKPTTENLHHDISKRLENPLSEIGDKFRYRNKEVSAYIKNGLDNISLSFDDKLKKIDKDEKSTMDSVKEYINKIHSVKPNGNSSSEAIEIKNILNGTSNIVITAMKNDNSNSAKINNILTSLGHQSNNKNESSIQSTISMLAEDNTSKDDRSETHPGGFKDLFEKNVENGSKSAETENVQNSEKNIDNLSTHNLEENFESMDSLFGGSSANSESHNENLQQARNWLEESERSSSILNSLFEKFDQSGQNIFDTL